MRLPGVRGRRGERFRTALPALAIWASLLYLGWQLWARWGPVAEHPVAVSAEARQWSAISCGPAAVATVVAAYGQRWERAEMERECGLTRIGTSLENLRLALERRGFQARGLRARSPTSLLRIPRPFIAYVGGAVPSSDYATGHFLVVTRFRDPALEIFDPTTGKRSLWSVDELHRKGHGWVLSLRP